MGNSLVLLFLVGSPFHKISHQRITSSPRVQSEMEKDRHERDRELIKVKDENYYFLWILGHQRAWIGLTQPQAELFLMSRADSVHNNYEVYGGNRFPCDARKPTFILLVSRCEKLVWRVSKSKLFPGFHPKRVHTRIEVDWMRSVPDIVENHHLQSSVGHQRDSGRHVIKSTYLEAIFVIVSEKAYDQLWPTKPKIKNFTRFTK